jgi:hypothetical protein
MPPESLATVRPTLPVSETPVKASQSSKKSVKGTGSKKKKSA